MASSRSRVYNMYKDAASDTKAKPGYHKLRRLRQKGLLIEENLAENGIAIKWRKPQKKQKEVATTINTDQASTSQCSLSTSCASEIPTEGSSNESVFQGNFDSCNLSHTNLDSLTEDLELDYSVSDISESSGDEDNDDDETNRDVNSILNSKLIGHDVLNERLYPTLNVTKFETMMMIMHLSMKHGMTGVCLQDLIDFVNEIFGNPNTLPSKHLFGKLFMFQSKPTTHFYCPKCSIYLSCDLSISDGLIQCGECDWSSTVSSHNDGYYFMSLSVRDQIRDVLRKPNLQFVSKDRLDNIVSDIMDGKMYKILSKEGNILANPNALTLTFNTDGSPVFKSGPNSLWPIHFFINEIHPSQRYDVDNMLLGGLWFGKSEPNIQIFLKPFVEELKELQNNGVVWMKSDGKVVESPVYALSCCCDSVARPKVQQLHQFNGAFGCGLCLHPNTSFTYLEKIENRSGLVVGTSSDAGDGPQLVFRRKKIMRYLRGDYKLRTNKELREHMKLAAAADMYDHVMGATGVSVLCELKYFNVVYGFIIDYLHNVLLGTLKRLAGYWFDSTNHGAKYYIGLSIERIDKRLAEITLPKGFRPPRPMSDRCHWHANEWRAFLFYFGLPVLASTLPSIYYNHFKKFVRAVYTLTKDSILHDEVDHAHQLLKEFVHEYQDLYGETNMVYNAHITSHLAIVVSQMGPLWAYSAFPFESANGRLVKLVRGTKGVVTQISKKYIMTKSIPTLLRNNYKLQDKVLDFCSRVIGFNYLKHSRKGNNQETLLGRQHYFSLNDSQKQAFVDKNLPVPHTVLVVNRIVVSGTLYHGRLTTKQKKACDSCVRLTSGEFALIDLIFSSSPRDELADVTFIVTKLNVAIDPSPLLVSHIKQCSLDAFGEQALIKSDEISRKCIFYTCTDRYFVAEFSNFYEVD